MILAAQIFRTWAAGFVGTTARGRVAQAETLLTAGPYAYVRNPMYLGALIITTAFAAMSGLPYALPIAWAAYAFVYASVIPYEEAYLRQRFGREYEAYWKAVLDQPRRVRCGLPPKLQRVLRSFFHSVEGLMM
jgi:protein-S-isoprenylcysteine O-methyltransferase Ste14